MLTRELQEIDRFAKGAINESLRGLAVASRKRAQQQGVRFEVEGEDSLSINLFRVEGAVIEVHAWSATGEVVAQRFEAKIDAASRIIDVDYNPASGFRVTHGVFRAWGYDSIGDALTPLEASLGLEMLASIVQPCPGREIIRAGESGFNTLKMLLG